MPEKTPLIRPTDSQAIEMAQSLIRSARFASLGVLHPETHTPHVTRVALGTTPDNTPLSLISDLSFHTTALRANAACSILVGEPEAKGDPLTHPRLSLQCQAEFVTRESPGFGQIRADYLATHPKSKLYIDFADFNFVLFRVSAAALNGGFGKAYALKPKELLTPQNIGKSGP